MTSPFHDANATARLRLETFVRGLSDDELQRPSPYGGTVAGLLAHLAFWDRRVTVLLRRWKGGGVDESPVDADMINDALVTTHAALSPRAAAELCLAAAAEADAEIETVTPELLAAIEASGVYIRLNRGLHRAGHLADLERLVGE